MKSTPTWALPPCHPILTENEVHIWRVYLVQPASVYQALCQMLAPEELRRADRFYFQHHREHFVVGRGALRYILGRYLGVSPAQIQFQYGEYGKPALAPAFQSSDLRFNLSHSHQLALVAVGRGREIGIDIEYIRADLAAEKIAAHFFSPAEVATLRSLPAALQKEAFFRCWTRKEAYLKARGEGLTHPLHQFDVSLIPGQPARLLCTRRDPDEAARWTLLDIEPGSNYVAALAVEGEVASIQTWNWPAVLRT